MNDLNSLFEQDANALTIKDDDLTSVGALAKRAKELEKEIEGLDKVSVSARNSNASCWRKPSPPSSKSWA